MNFLALYLFLNLNLKQSFEHHNFGHIFDKLTEEIGSPVEFELPDWVKDQNPNTYTFIRRSIHIVVE